MANDIDIRIGVSGGDDILKVAKLTQKLDRDVATLAKTFNKGKITSQAYFKGLNQQVSALTKQGVAYKRAQSYIFAQAKAVRNLDAKTDLLTGSINQNTGAVLNNAKALGATKNKMNGSNMAIQQLGYQFGDFAVQVQGGTSAFVAFSQQGAQLAGILPMIAGPLGLSMGAAVGLSAAFGILIPIGSAVGRMLFEMGGNAESSAKKIKAAADEIKTAFDELKSASKGTGEAMMASIASPLSKAKSELSSLLEAWKAVKAEILKQSISTGIKPIVKELAKGMDALRIKKAATIKFNIGTSDEAVAKKQNRINEINAQQLEITNSFNKINKATSGPSEDLVDNMIAVGVAIRDSELATDDMKDSILALLGESGILAEKQIQDAEKLKKKNDQIAKVDAENARLLAEDAAKRAAAEEAIKKAEQDAMKTRAGFMALGLSNSLAQAVANKKEEAAVKKITDAVDKNTKSSQRKIILNRAELDVLNNVAGAEEHLAVLKAEHAREDHIAKLVAEKILGKNLDVAMEHYDYLVYQQTALDDLNEKEKARLELLKLQAGYTSRIFEGSAAGIALSKYGARGTVGTPPKDPTETTEPKGPKVVDPYANLQKQLELEEALIGKTEARKRVINALGVDQSKWGPEAVTKLENEVIAVQKLQAAEEERIRVIEEAKKQQEDLADTIERSMGDAFMAMSDGTKSVSDAFRTMAAEIVRELYKVYVMQVAIAAIKTFAGGLFAADGAVLSGGSEVKAYADGGVVGGPTTFPMAGGKTGLMGEAGPEAIMPLKRGANGKLGVQAEGGSGDIYVTNNYSISANTSEDTKRLVTQTIQQAQPALTQAAKASIMNDRRRGGQMKSVFG